jgi:hypothetical protein
MADIQVIGIGPPRTGTMTLKRALRILGHVPGNESDPHSTCLVGDGVCLPPDRYKALDQRYPDAKFIYTKRETPQAWLDSVNRRTAFAKKNEGTMRQRERMYGSRDVVPAIYLAFYMNRLKEVVSYFSLKYPDTFHEKVLLVCWEMGDGWDELCKFLDLPLPGVKFPHINKSKR